MSNEKQQKTYTCSFCRQKIKEEDNIIIQSNKDEKSFICFNCVKDLYNKLNPIAVKKEKLEQKEEVSDKYTTPSKIKAYLDNYIVGQEKAKQVISVAVYNHYKSIRIKEKDNSVELEKSNIILLGPSGCGKTAIVKALSKMLNVPFAIEDATCLTESGYVGSDVEIVLQKLLENANGDIKKAQQGIVYIDEIDKISRKGENLSTTADPGHEGVQQSLLKIIEGSVVDVPQKGNRKHPQGEVTKIDTSNILFIVGGAFEGIEDIIANRLKQGKSSIGFESTVVKDKEKDYNKFITDVKTEDLKSFGILPELLGRLPIICPMKELTEEALIKILTEPKNALIKQYQRILKEDNVDLVISKKALKAIAHKAIERKTGARSLRSIMEEILNDVFFTLPDDLDINKVFVDYRNNEFVTIYNQQ